MDAPSAFTEQALCDAITKGDSTFTISKCDKLEFVRTLGIDTVVAVCVRTIRRQNTPITTPLERVEPAALGTAITATNNCCQRNLLPTDEAWWYSQGKTAVTRRGPVFRATPSALSLSTLLSGTVRYATPCQANCPSPNDLWASDAVLDKAIRYVCTNDKKKDSDALSVGRLRVFCMQGHGCRYPTAFPIPVAMAVMRRVAAELPAWDTLRVADPCAGWGDRLAAAILCGANYIGMDPWRVSVNVCAKIHTRLGGSAHQCVVLSDGAENPWPVADNSMHIVFTSPPYGSLEKYGVAGPEDERRHQAWKLPAHDFVAAFMGPLMRNAWRALVPRGRLILNIADSSAQTMVADTILLAETLGFTLETIYGMSLSARATQTHGEAGARAEPLFVFRKT